MKNLYREFWNKYWKEIFQNIILLIVISALSILGPLLLREALNNNIEKGFQLSEILTYVFVITALYVIKFLYNRYKFWFQEKFKNNETTSLYRKIFKMSYQSINNLEPTYLVERVNATINTIFKLYSSSITGIFVSILTMSIILIVIFRINRVLAVLYFFQIPIQYFGFKKLLNGEKSRLSEFGAKLQEEGAKGNKNIKAILSDVNCVKQYGSNAGIISFIRNSVSSVNKIERQANVYAMDMCTILEYICQIIKNASYILIVYLYINGDATVGDLVYLNLMNDIYFSSINDAINIQVNLRDLRASMKFIVSEVESNYEMDGVSELSEINKVEGNIKNLGYGDSILIRLGSFSFKKGDVVGISGESGTGKSTIVKYLNKFYLGQDIKINNINIEKVNNHCIRKKVVYLAQTSYLLPVSIKENILLGNIYDNNKWEELLKKDFMQKFLIGEAGLETLVLENASNLSGGDRQKIILARAFLQEPDVIILDESFSAIDETTGEKLIEEIINIYSNKIIIIISHSEKYLKKCNTRVIIEDRQLKQISQ